MINLKGFDLILGSKSPYRFKLLQEAGYDPRILSAEIDEKKFGDRENSEKLHEVPLEIAKAKRDAILKDISPKRQKALLITADQISVHDTLILEKPSSGDEIRRRLEVLMGSIRPLQFWNGLTVTNLWTGASIEATDSSFTIVRKIPKEILLKIIENEIFLTCASGVMIEHPLYSPYVIKTSGGFDTIIGLTISLFEKLAKELL